MNATNLNFLITVTESCLDSWRLLNQQRHLLWHLGLLGQVQHLEPGPPCLPPAHSSRVLESYSRYVSEKGVPQRPVHLCRHVYSYPCLQRTKQPGGRLFLQTCVGTLLHFSVGTTLDTSASTLLHGTVERRREAITAWMGFWVTPLCLEEWKAETGLGACVVKHPRCQLLLQRTPARDNAEYSFYTKLVFL